MELSQTEVEIQRVIISHLHQLDPRESVTLELYLNKVLSHKNKSKRFLDLNQKLEITNKYQKNQQVTRGLKIRRSRNQVKNDAPYLQAEEQARRQQHISKTHDRTGRDHTNQQSHSQYQQNNHYFLANQSRPILKPKLLPKRKRFS